jgi:hypothetical protein
MKTPQADGSSEPLNKTEKPRPPLKKKQGYPADLGDKHIGATEDQVVRYTSSSRRGIQRRAEAGLVPPQPAFSASTAFGVPKTARVAGPSSAFGTNHQQPHVRQWK